MQQLLLANFKILTMDHSSSPRLQGLFLPQTSHGSSPKPQILWRISVRAHAIITAVGTFWIFAIDGQAQAPSIVSPRQADGSYYVVGTVLSVTDDGVLVTTEYSVNRERSGSTPFLIRGRFNYVDGDRVSLYVVPDGTFRYKTALGSEATVRAYKVVDAKARVESSSKLPAVPNKVTPADADSEQSNKAISSKERDADGPSNVQSEPQASDVRIIPGTGWVASIGEFTAGSHFCQIARNIEDGVQVAFTTGTAGSLALVVADKYMQGQVSDVLGWGKQGQSYRAVLRFDGNKRTFTVEAVRMQEDALLIPLKSINTEMVFRAKRLEVAVGAIAVRFYDLSGLEIAGPELLECARNVRNGPDRR